jgi:hypothetical protein
MNINYEILTEVRFEHEYFSSMFSAFNVCPSEDSRKKLRDFGMEFREQYGRFFIFFDVFHGGEKRSREAVLSKALCLVFTLELTDLMFFNYTAVLSMNVQQSVFYFSNRIVGKQALHRQELVSDKDVYAYPLTFFREDGMVKPFGKIVLKIAPGLLDVYLIRFEAMATYWRYILVSDYLKAIKNPVVLDQQTQVIFKGPNPIELPSGLTGVAFVSPEPIKLSSKTAARYQLLENSEDNPEKRRVIVRALQNPNPVYISSLPVEQEPNIKSNYSEIII